MTARSRTAAPAKLAAVLAGVLLATVAATPASGAPLARTTALISTPTGVLDPGTNGGSFAGASADGSRVFFETTQRLTPDDAESNRRDVYERSGGTTSLVSQASGIADPASADASFAGATPDGDRVFLITPERLTADDNDSGRIDIYERANGVTTLVSGATGVPDPNTADVQFRGISRDGTRVVFITTQKLTADDNDTNRSDVYVRSGGVTALISAPTGVADPDTAGVTFAVPSADGSRVFFTTAQKLTADDGDTGRADVYERSGDTTKLVSAPTGVADPDLADVDFGGSSRDGTRVFFTTTQNLTADDGDTNRQDVYERSEGTTTLVSRPAGVADPDTGDAGFGGASADGSDVFFTTSEALTADDGEPNLLDVYAARAPQPDPGPGPGPDVTAPALSGYGLTPSIFRAASRGPAVARRRPVGTRVRHTLSEPASVTFRVERAVKGVRVRGKCRAPARGKRGARRCVRYVTLRGSFTHAGLAGPNRLRFTGRLRGRGLRPGRYRLTARAVDAAGNASSVARRPFRIVRR